MLMHLKTGLLATLTRHTFIAGHKSISPTIMPWAPQVVHGQIPVNASGRLYAATPVAVYAAANDFAFNLGDV